MQVSQGSPLRQKTSPRVFDEKSMILDFEYEMVQKLTVQLHQKGLLSESECERIQALNKQTFSPLYKEIMV
ncbi:hypothetical protein I4Q36_05175 [Tuanshanicoccus lijuaniae]|uniref:SHOCT domain-containing protein n=1 Tax=Aerococcaceae bacterium zg-1292 TaxID=2774330 RepID=UPI001937BEFE|nr:hypothetical protein [Aerococcaceae bacterium zg-1292]QQA38064.1 hypothetical protein I4Q36_05175 [Aerococcaceae bacterium zg-1292]